MIDYYSIVRAITYYLEKGYKHIEVPWLVSQEVMQITCPHDRTIFPLIGEELFSSDGAEFVHHYGQYLVASGEQGFLQLLKDKKLAPGKYVTVTPCFRDDKLDELHQRYFFKAELIVIPANQNSDSILEEHHQSLKEMITLADELFREGMSLWRSTEIVDTQHITKHPSFDIQTKKKKIELGSYGIRQHPLVGTWIYGTGVAEPRLSYAREHERS